MKFRDAASNSAYYGYPELWILRYPAHRYHAVPSPGFKPTTLWLRVRRPNHSATTLHILFICGDGVKILKMALKSFLYRSEFGVLRMRSVGKYQLKIP
jgi:hypothetical protein